jgi:hypothetical protein
MFLNSTERLPIRIENQDPEIEWEEPFQSRIGLSSFGDKRRGSFMGWFRVMKPLLNERLNLEIESEISQRDMTIKSSKLERFSLASF